MSSLAMGLFAGCCIVAVAGLSHQPLGTESGWNKIVLAVTLGPVLEEVILQRLFVDGWYSAHGASVPIEIAALLRSWR